MVVLVEKTLMVNRKEEGKGSRYGSQGHAQVIPCLQPGYTFCIFHSLLLNGRSIIDSSKPGLVEQVWNPSAQEVEAKGPQVQGHPRQPEALRLHLKTDKLATTTYSRTYQ